MKKKLIRLYTFYKQYINWKKLLKQVSVAPALNTKTACLAIIPCDPFSVGGSRGDEAMIMGVIQYYRKINPSIPIYVVCHDDAGEHYIKRLNLANIHAVVSWNGLYPLNRVYSSVIQVSPTDVVILGADCMDGFYSPDLSQNLLALHDLFSHTKGIKSRLLGFSFNEKPSWLMIRAFKTLSSDVSIRLRDSVSYNRYTQITGKPAQLLADAAFLLQPDSRFPLYDEIKTWIDCRKSEGQIVVGFNFHPMLRKYNGVDDIKGDALILAKNVEQILSVNSKVSFVFISHDDRSSLTDNLMLSTMYEYLYSKISSESLNLKIFYSTLVPRASQLKAIVGLLDGLVSSRMHLAIAALGMNVPVMAATYQGKFEGLFKHFDLDNTFLLAPAKFISADMPQVFNHFITQLPQLRQQISNQLPNVINLSQQNLSDE